ncbi:type I restriction enzyme [Streptomyces sp. Y2F8-2]|uniref:type I restriction endonuclease subunit R n=1 Tax=Streptomyces sp. Y2F8-2 TaxID=2759675 RepID=UPI001905A2ED|nr:type I restriction endonuclease [Streptomyces sp. Y2F8-2]GHK04556.1 type I restriction enzyme [Streptomyces sp. Y2F8-2]
MAQPEYELVEKPLIDQLVAMGWTHCEGAPPGAPAAGPADSGRASFQEVVYEKRFFDAVSRLNPGPDGERWLGNEQLRFILDRLMGRGQGQDPHASRGVAGNLHVTAMLREGVNARTLPGWRKGQPEHVRLVDWEQPARRSDSDPRGNDLLAVSQFRVERGGPPRATPDLVLFVNGLPWAVIECKAPVLASPESRIALDAAVGQVVGYAGADQADAVTEFTRFAQVLVATDGTHAEIGTVTAEPADFAAWRTCYPAREQDVRAELGASEGRKLTGQEILVAGVLRPAHLLSLVRDFTTQAGRGPRTVKVIGRYQQFRAVHRIARMLRERREAHAAGKETHHRGGLTWHTQGSGKSLTMAFLVRHLRSTPELSGHKVVVVTDRRDLEKQIRRSLAAANERIYRSRNVRQARRYLAVDVPDVVLVMLQKARRDDTAFDGREEFLATEPGGTDHVHNQVANGAHDIIVLVDEAHRGQYAWQHARLRAMLPNAVMVGFTGTPLISRVHKTTEEVFGPFLDTYTLRDAERDRAVVPVRYAAESVSLEVLDKARLDAGFDERIPADPDRRRRALRKFGRRKEILQSPSVIRVKAEHMMWHWATTAMRDGLSAQVVAVSRRAAVLYQQELTAARDRLVRRIDALGALRYDPEAEERETDPERRELIRLASYRGLLARIEIAAVISGRRGDDRAWEPWTDKRCQDDHIERFKQGVPARDPGVRQPWNTDARRSTHRRRAVTSTGAWNDTPRPTAAPTGSGSAGDGMPIAFMVVNSMLLTGFDAPPEQVLYLDRMLTGAGLLQGIARTNRPYPAKDFGLVVDYVGVGPELARSIAEYEAAHLRAVLGYQDLSLDHLDPEHVGPQPTRDRLWLQADAAADALLADRHRGLTDFLGRLGLTDPGDEHEREDLLARLDDDPLLCGEFDERVRGFLTALNAVLPRLEALAYETFAHEVGVLQYLARARRLDGRDEFSPRRYGAKVRDLIARHIIASGIEERVPPVQLTADDFLERVRANRDPRARVSYLRSRLSTHITARLNADRARYERFSERLEEVIRRMGEDFEQAADALENLACEVRDAESGNATGAGGLDPWTEQPIHGLLGRDYPEADGPVLPKAQERIKAARDIAACLAVQVQSPNFPRRPEARERVRKQVRLFLEDELHVDWEVTGPLANLLVELAVERHEDFLRYGRRSEDRAS